LPLFGEKEAERFACNKCGFETNSPAIFTLHKKNCPRV
jgi:ribosomal protein S27AE